MTPERWREVRAVFDRLAPLSEGERETALAALAAHDEELAREARSLLAAEARDAGFLAAPVVDSAPATGGDRRGERVGPWELLAPLGAGGMGQVFLARRADRSFDKLVAVKLVHAELLSPLLRERFAAERQALAGLEHPGIARLLDGGESASGEPFLVLEYVEGSSLLDFAARRELSRRRRIALFLQVLRAVAYAHRHLVVHRDLKPANILVTEVGEAKLLDFGVAKILAPEAADGGSGRAATHTSLRALTPEYASPEQILGGATTTATDIYALGVVLFELLTGRRPYRVPTGAPQEWADAALHQEVGPAAELGRDLEAVLRRALRKDPAARYATVDAFAEDLHRYLDGRPVAARRGGLGYRAARFAGRHRGALTASAVALALLVGLAAVAADRLRRERDRAALEAATARSVADFLATLFQKADPARARGAKLTAREVLEQGALRIERDLAAQPAVQAKLLTVLGAVHRDLGLLDSARPLLEKALALRESGAAGDALGRAESLYEAGTLDRLDGDLERARQRLESALALREARLAPDDLEVARTLAALSAVLRQAGDVGGALPLVMRALAIANRAGSGIAPAEAGRWLNNLGLLHQDAGDYEQALAAFTESLAILDRSEGPDSPLPAIPLDNLGQALRQVGRAEEALPRHRRAEELVKRTWGPEHPQYGTALNSLGTTLSALDRRAEAIDCFRRAAAVYTAALGPDHPAVSWPLRNQAEALLALERPAEALPLFERALAIRRAAHGDAHPDTAQSLTDLGLGYAALGDLDAAERWLREGLKQSRVALEPANLGVAEAEIFLADLLVRRRRPDEARALYTEALPILRAAMPGDDPRILAVEAQLAGLSATPGGA